jgi:hypothetical protein
MAIGLPSKSIQESIHEPVKVQQIKQPDFSDMTIVSAQQEWQATSPWFNKYWRALSAYTYIVICVTDFIVFPVLWNIAQIYTKGALTVWQPMTLSGGGLFHLAFGAILGVSAFGRTKENLTRMG